MNECLWLAVIPKISHSQCFICKCFSLMRLLRFLLYLCECPHMSHTCVIFKILQLNDHVVSLIFSRGTYAVYLQCISVATLFIIKCCQSLCMVLSFSVLNIPNSWRSLIRYHVDTKSLTTTNDKHIILSPTHVTYKHKCPQLKQSA